MDAALVAPGATILPMVELPNIAFTPMSASVAPAAAAAAVVTPVATYAYAVPAGSGVSGLSGLPEKCHPSYTPPLASLGDLKGQVCQFTFPANLLSIARCCDGKAQPQMQGNCTQYCEISDTKAKFQTCVKGLLETLPKEERPKNWKIKCQSAGATNGTVLGKSEGIHKMNYADGKVAETSGASGMHKSISVAGVLAFSLAFVSFAAL